MKKMILTVVAMLTTFSTFASSISIDEIQSRQIGGKLSTRGDFPDSVRFLCDEPVMKGGVCTEGAIVEVTCAHSVEAQCKSYYAYELRRFSADGDNKRIPTHFKNIAGSSLTPHGLAGAWWFSGGMSGEFNPLGIVLYPVGLAIDVATMPLKFVRATGAAIGARVRLRQFLRSVRKNKRGFSRKMGRKSFEFLVNQLGRNKFKAL